jgi:hypothetical protein
VEKYGRAGQATAANIMWCMHFAFLITETADTHSEYVILIAFMRQWWLQKRASILYYTCIVCLVVRDSGPPHCGSCEGYRSC